MTQEGARIFHVRNSEKCYRYKEEAIINHAPAHKGIYELVTFDINQKPTVLYVGAAFTQTLEQALSAHLNGTLSPSVNQLLENNPNLYFDFLSETDAKTQEDAQDIYWWLVQKYKPPYNDVTQVRHSGRPGHIHVVEE